MNDCQRCVNGIAGLILEKWKFPIQFAEKQIKEETLEN